MVVRCLDQPRPSANYDNCDRVQRNSNTVLGPCHEQALKNIYLSAS
eukprot:COSAG03_NODE_4185_length_1648_cov_3.334860_1_plen_45_part_10